VNAMTDLFSQKLKSDGDAELAFMDFESSRSRMLELFGSRMKTDEVCALIFLSTLPSEYHAKLLCLNRLTSANLALTSSLTTVNMLKVRRRRLYLKQICLSQHHLLQDVDMMHDSSKVVFALNAIHAPNVLRPIVCTLST
jgi:hypothetical protein